MRIAALFLIRSTQIYAQVLKPKTYSTTGKPTEAMSTPDCQYVLVMVNTGGSSGIDVFHLEGDNLKRTVFQPLGNDGATASAAGTAMPPSSTSPATSQPCSKPSGPESSHATLSASPDGATLYLTIFNSNELMVLHHK